MKTLKEFYTPGYTDLTDKSEIEKYLEIANKNNGIPIYRGMSLTSDYILIDGEKIERRSRNTTNEYTEILGFLPNWSEYPKRSKSLICSFNFTTSTFFSVGKKYGEQPESYRVYPLENQKVGICPTDDFWGSFMTNFRNFFEYTSYANELNFKIRAIIRAFFPLEYKGFEVIEYLRKLDKLLKNYTVEQLKKEYSYLLDDDDMTLLLAFKENGSLNFLQKFLDPKDNKFELYNYLDIPSTFKDKNRECWVSGKCLLVKIKEDDV